MPKIWQAIAVERRSKYSFRGSSEYVAISQSLVMLHPMKPSTAPNRKRGRNAISVVGSPAAMSSRMMTTTPVKRV
jgi:hypothetical protein